MKTAQKILKNLKGENLYTTVRGTMGDAEYISKVDNDLIDYFSGADIIKLSDGSAEFQDARAYDDIIDELDKHLDHNAKTSNYDRYYVIYKNNQYLLAWE